jgi:hypothetical protein
MSAPPVRIEIPAEQVVVGDYLPHLEWDAGEYRETGNPGPRVIGVELTPEGRWDGDRSLVVDIRSDAHKTAPNHTRCFYSGEIVTVWRFEK